jgi:ferredoxin-NADP reductase
MSMIRAHGAAKSQVPVGLIYSARSPADVIYSHELSERTVSSPLNLTLLYTRSAHRGVPPGRINAAVIAASAFPPAAAPAIYVCGPSGSLVARPKPPHSSVQDGGAALWLAGEASQG